MKYLRTQEKKKFRRILAETYEFLIEVKRDERQACTEYQASLRGDRISRNDDAAYWFAAWQDATRVLHGHRMNVNSHECHCMCMDAHMEMSVPRYERYVWGF